MHNDAIRARLSFDSEDELRQFLAFCRKSGIELKPFAFRGGSRQIVRALIELPQNPTGFDYRSNKD